MSTLKVLLKKIKPPSALYLSGLKTVFINTFCPIALNFLPEYTCLIHSCFCTNSSFGLKQAPAFVDNVYSADENLATDNNIAPILFAILLQNVLQLAFGSDRHPYLLAMCTIQRKPRICHILVEEPAYKEGFTIHNEGFFLLSVLFQTKPELS